MTELFDNERQQQAVASTLAQRLRPKTLDAVVGQDHLLGKRGTLKRLLERSLLPSMVFWGPPGCGKTTMVHLIAQSIQAQFYALSAVFSSVGELRKIFSIAQQNQKYGKKTILFVDEIHRFNKAQQDSFLPYVEAGVVILMGATTENPSFELNSALLSRIHVFTLNRLDENALHTLLQKAENLLGKDIPLDKEARKSLLNMADGDGRSLLNMVELLMHVSSHGLMTVNEMFAIIQNRMPVYDKDRDTHYNLLSAFHKSVRGSDVQASLYWLGRILDGGDDPLSIARRMLCIAYEDIGLADPTAAQQVLMAWDSYARLGSPEGERCLVQACIYLATAPKSNTVNIATQATLETARKYGSLSPPKHILNAPTNMMKSMGYGKGYQYDHDCQDSFSGQSFLPENIEHLQLYDPAERGFEREIKKRFLYYQQLRKTRHKT